MSQFEMETPFIKQVRKSYFETMLQELKSLNLEGFEFEKTFASSSANGAMRVSWRKPNWLSSSDILQRDRIDSNYRILLQSSFVPTNNRVTIEIHYETEPYYPRSQIRDEIIRGVISQQNANTYKEDRKNFVDLFQEKCKDTVWPEGVNILRRNTFFTFAVLKIPVDVEAQNDLKQETFNTLAKKIKACSESFSQIVEQIWAELL